MTKNNHYLAGAPCWVDTLQPDPRAALHFYGPLFGWSFDDATPMPAGLGEGEYFTARLGEHRVAGIGQAPPASPATWMTHVGVDDIALAIVRAEAAGGTPLVRPTDAGSDGRLAVLTDSTGVPFCLWQAGERTGAELVGEPGTWAMSSLHSTDPEQAQGFYGAAFGWEPEPVPGAPFSKWRLAGRVVAVLTATDGVAVPPHWSVNFAVRDADAIAEHATSLGGKVLMAPFDTPGFRNAVITDPQGGVIAVSAPA
ncbi:VOC family protein [Saccharopolyspora erythraea]|uniref:VOC family protein n=1 Tax=Saccharopolyspora erythraea TaxID=1836 RepID=UPI001BA7B379|nr:VOC family protein [Saccharopolyspora erythraea]QUH01977.1 VOC family protein [Saccharopolyspora erythraea]